MMNIPVEVEEHQFPVLTEYATFRQDSEGPGRYRGGFGFESAFRIRTEAELFVGIERTQCPPWGIAGGSSALSNNFFVQSAPGEELVSTLKAQHVKVDSNSLCIIRTGGGGGYGRAFERDPAKVAEEARLGYITIGHARDAYGVVLDSATFKVDEEATRSLRGSRSL